MELPRGGSITNGATSTILYLYDIHIFVTQISDAKMFFYLFLFACPLGPGGRTGKIVFFVSRALTKYQLPAMSSCNKFGECFEGEILVFLGFVAIFSLYTLFSIYSWHCSNRV